MALSCECDSDYAWYFSVYFSVSEDWYIAATKFMCYGCCEMKPALSMVRHMYEHRIDEDGGQTEDELIGRMCEACCDQYDSLSELGFCLETSWGFITESMNEYHRDYLGLRYGD